MKQDVDEYYESLGDIYTTSKYSLVVAYRQLRELLERVCRSFMFNESLQMTDLAARINFLGTKYGMKGMEVNHLHTFRLTSNDILNKRTQPNADLFLRDLKTVAFTIRKLFKQDIPLQLYMLLPKQTAVAIPSSKITIYKRLRVCFQYADDTYLYVVPVDFISEELLRIRYNIVGHNDEFNATIGRLWQYAQLNLLDVSVDEHGNYVPSFIVLEPDYLIDISSLAECFKDYGCHSANYNLSKLLPISNSRPLLLGNIANLFLDEWIHADGDVDYLACMKKAFKSYSIEIAACEDLQDKEKEIQFFNDCKLHFEHIREIVTDTFCASGYDLHKEDAVLEPSYICEALGVQGRLDYMQRDMSSFIEMKSGKANEFAIRGKIEPKENNRIQMLLYMAVLEYNMGKDHNLQHPYLLYTRYPLLYPARASWAMVKRVINVRNQIVANEYSIQLHNNISYTALMLGEINLVTLNENHLKGRFWEQYLKPTIDRFRRVYANMTSLEQTYYLRIYNFITKELYTSKSGDIEYEGRTGTASLWLSTLAEKCEAGEILYDLQIVENHATDEHKANVILAIPHYEDDFLPNFRSGDVVVLYERNSDEDRVTNKMVFKGCIDEISSDRIKIRIRARQRNISVLPEDSLYAVEHDTMDTAFKNMYQGLYAFSESNQDRRDLLLSQRIPCFDTSYVEKIEKATDDFERVALKAVASRDFFLLVGPPGTGKTSRALRRMVEMFYASPDSQLLLLAYTNKAVDEICKSLLSIKPNVKFIRIGSELSCDEAYREYLIENVLADCNRRSEVYECISTCRVFVGTVASIANKPELFRLKTFDAAIVDEATQILEPQLLGILCAKNSQGDNALGRFILIGDHKQLPAVVLQNEIQSRVGDENLNAIGLVNLRDSLFERLYRKYLGDGSWAVDMLCKQGRMNPEVALFPNQFFYEGKLELVGLPHQFGNLVLSGNYKSSFLKDLLTQRIAFIPSKLQKDNISGKTNLYEARIVALLSKEIYLCHQECFNAAKTLGIITPYRSQIALIKKEIMKLDISALNEVLVDTVERFQGSERDIIIYSFSVNHKWQLKFLSNVMEENGQIIDRKLNVALTRARQQLFITGVPSVLQQNTIYNNLLKLIKQTMGFTDLFNY